MIDIIGRQLFVDDFVIANRSGTQRTFYQVSKLNLLALGCSRKPPCAIRILAPQVKYHPTPVLEPETSWERKGGAYTRPYSGGIWWEPRESRFKMFYGASRLSAFATMYPTTLCR